MSDEWFSSIFIGLSELDVDSNMQTRWPQQRPCFKLAKSCILKKP